MATNIKDNLEPLLDKNPEFLNKRENSSRCLAIAVICCSLVAVIFSAYITYAIHTSRQDCESHVRKARSITQYSREVCDSEGCVHTASSVLKNMNPKVEPCENFYDFACGSFMNYTILSEDDSLVSSIEINRDKVLKQVKISLEKDPKPGEPRTFRLLRTYYKSCMNKSEIESNGPKPLLANLKKLGGWPVLMRDAWNETNFDWKESVYALRKMGYLAHTYFFKCSVERNAKKRVILIDQPVLSIHNDYLLNVFNDESIKTYHDFMVDIAVILGANKTDAQEQLKQSLEFEIKLANISLLSEKGRDAATIYNPMTVAEHTEQFPSIPWAKYIETLLTPTIKFTENIEKPWYSVFGDVFDSISELFSEKPNNDANTPLISNNEYVFVTAPNYFKQFEKLMQQTPKRVQANYVMWRAVKDSLKYLNDKIRKREFDFSYDLYGYGISAPRWDECVNSVLDRFPIGLGALYVRNYFDGSSKKKLVEMFSNIKTSFIENLEKIDWMESKTKAAAMNKVKYMISNLAYPDELINDKILDDFHKKLELTAGNYLGNDLNTSIFDIEFSFELLRRPYNNWFNRVLSASIKAAYDPSENTIHLPAGILQGAYFSNNRPEYMNYGAIGIIIGHEISHGFDNNGRQFDKEGALNNWWDEETEKKFHEKSLCMINQYSNYTVVEAHTNLNGANTLQENIADNAGVKIAYKAYNDWVKRNGEEQLLIGLNYTSRQMFWISWANTLCTKYQPTILQHLLKSNKYSPGKFRVLGPISNSPEFAEDFQCLADSKMNPKNKCNVW